MPLTRMRLCFVALVLAVFALPCALLADQRHPVDPSVLAATVAQHAAKQDADRTAIRQALAQPEVRQVADRMGVDLGRVSATVGTLTGSDLERSAAAARQVNDALAGGASTITITTTTLIIILLVVILIVVAVK